MIDDEISVEMTKRDAIDYIRGLNNGGYKIHAIKFARKVFDYSLKEAKDFVENDCNMPMQTGDRVKTRGDYEEELTMTIGTVMAVHTIGRTKEMYYWVLNDGDNCPMTHHQSNVFRI